MTPHQARRWSPADRDRRCRRRSRILRGLPAPRQIEHGKRQAPVLRLGAARMEQDDHAREPARQNPEVGGRALAAPARLPRPHGPLPAIPGAIDLPRNAQVAAQFGEHLRVEILDALQRVGSEAVRLLELLVALPDHHFAVLAALVDGRIDDHEAAAGPQAAADFGERAAIVGGVVYRRVVDGRVQAARGQRQDRRTPR